MDESPNTLTHHLPKQILPAAAAISAIVLALLGYADLLEVSLALLLAFGVLASWLAFLIAKRRRPWLDPILLDLGTPHKVSYWRILFSALFGLAGMVVLTDVQQRPSRFFEGLLLLSGAIISFRLNRVTTVLTESGISVGDVGIPWQHIERFTWQGQKDGAELLWLQTRGYLRFFGPSEIRIPPDWKDAVQALLMERVTPAQRWPSPG
jgi:hypothetical protein